MITLNTIQREGKVKSEINALRRTGHIPYVLYSKGAVAEIGSIVSQEMEAAMRSLRPGFLPTTIFSLKDASGRERKVIVKEIQYKPTTYQIIHLDFFELIDSNIVQIKVPVEFLNAVDCVGVKLGGFLRHSMRHVKVSCFPKDIPTHFEIDVKDLDLNQHRKVKDLQIPQGVTCLAKPEDIVVAVVKK